MTAAAEQSAADINYGCIRLRGLPFTVSCQDIVHFLSEYTVVDVLLSKSQGSVGRTGKPNGQAYVVLPAAEAARALQEKNNAYIGKRYIELFASSLSDMETARRFSGPSTVSNPNPQHRKDQMSAAEAMEALPQLMQAFLNMHSSPQQQTQLLAFQPQSQQLQTLQLDTPLEMPQYPYQQQQQLQEPQQRPKAAAHIIRLRGLPFTATAADIEVFLSPVRLPPAAACIHIARHPDLRPTGEAYVQLQNESEVQTALKKHKSMMGKRYIEVFPSCAAEMQQVLSQNQQSQQMLCGPGLLSAPMVMATQGMLSAVPVSSYMQQAVAPSWPQQQQALPVTRDQLLAASLQQQQAAVARARLAAAAAAAVCEPTQQHQQPQLGLLGGSTGMQLGPGLPAQLQLELIQQQQMAASMAASSAAVRSMGPGIDMQYAPFYAFSSGMVSSGDLASSCQQMQDQQLLLGQLSLSMPSTLGCGFNAVDCSQQTSSAVATDMLSSSTFMNTATAALCNTSLLLAPGGCHGGGTAVNDMVSVGSGLNLGPLAM